MARVRKQANLKAKDYLDALNAGARCAVCGIDDLTVLQWAHRDRSEKLFNISNSWRYYGLDMVASEVAKCVRMCANCHLRFDKGLIDIKDIKE